jgi:phasin family protein
MANPSNPFGDLTAMMQQFKIPGLDIAPIIESRRKDMEALVEANKAAYAAMQALAQKQTEIMTEAMQGLQESAKGLMGGGMPDPVKQTELVRKAYEKALADMKELAEMARQSQEDAVAGITQRASQSMEEMKKLMRPK